MVVLHLVKTSEGATWAYRQMRELKKMDIEVHVAMPLGGKMVNEYLKVGIEVHDFKYELISLRKSIRGLRQIVNSVKPDIIHSHFVISTFLMRLALRNYKIPRVFQVPGPLHLENPIFRAIDIFLSQRNIDKWIGSCEWTNGRYIKSGICKSRLFLSYYGTDLDFIKRTTGKLKEVIGVSDETFVVGMVAYMYAPKKYLGQKRGLKGHEDYIDALALVLKKYPNVYGVCIGAAWNGALKYEREIIEYGKRKCGDHLIFLGNRDDVPALYSDMDLVIHPSHSENLGGAGESLLLEVPTIATNVGGFPDIVKDYYSGLLVPPKDPNQLAIAIEKVLTNKCDLNSFKMNGRILAENILDVRNSAKEIKKIYNNILKNTDTYNV